MLNQILQMVQSFPWQNLTPVVLLFFEKLPANLHAVQQAKIIGWPLSHSAAAGHKPQTTFSVQFIALSNTEKLRNFP